MIVMDVCIVMELKMMKLKNEYFCLIYFKYFIKLHGKHKGSIKYIFLESALKKKTEFFSNFFFYLKVQSFRLIMGNNFIQLAASAVHAGAYTIDTIFKHIIDYVQLYFTNGFTNIVL